MYNYKLEVLKEIAAQQNWMTELDEYNESNDDEDEAPQKAMTVDEYNKYDEIKLKYEELEAENRNVYKRLLKSNEQITNLVKIVMQNINMETIKSDLEEHKKIVTENKDKKNNKSIREFIETIELF